MKKLLSGIGVVIFGLMVAIPAYCQNVTTDTWLECRLENYCTGSESQLKRTAPLPVVTNRFSVNPGQDICAVHFTGWNFQYRLPPELRCGDGLFVKDVGS